MVRNGLLKRSFRDEGCRRRAACVDADVRRCTWSRPLAGRTSGSEKTADLQRRAKIEAISWPQNEIANETMAMRK